MSDPKLLVADAIQILRPFVSSWQMAALVDRLYCEEAPFFLAKIVELSAIIESMPATSDQDGAGDEARVYLHYFLKGSHWYIYERCSLDGVSQASGFAILQGMEDLAEAGYVSITEIVANLGELDLHFEACSLGVVRLRHAAGVPT